MSLLLSSPSGLEEERAGLRAVVAELNNTWSHRLRLRFEVIGWETHTHPDIGEDAQQVVNDQLPRNHDAFLGIMWNRFGTPTNRAGSGTEEEFETVVAQHKQSGNVHVLFYFKNAPINPLTADLQQLARVQAFKSRIEREGVLHSEFATPDEFANLARVHLSLLAQRLEEVHRGSAGAPPAQSGTTMERPVETPQDDEPGLLECQDMLMDRFASSVASLQRIASFMNSMTRTLTSSSSAIERAANTPRHQQVARRQAERAAVAMITFAQATTNELPSLSDSLRESITLLGRIFALSIDFGPDAASSLQEGINSLKNLRSTMAASIASAASMRDAASGIPRVTTSLIRAQRKEVEAINTFIGLTQAAIGQADETVARSEELLERLRQPPTAGA